MAKIMTQRDLFDGPEVEIINGNRKKIIGSKDGIPWPMKKSKNGVYEFVGRSTYQKWLRLHKENT